MHRFTILLSISLLAGDARAQGVKPVPADTLFYSVVSSGKNVAGSHKAWRDADGVHFFFEFNDRGRGPKLVEDVKLNPAGLPVSLLVRGNDYLKNRVDERFSAENGQASWKGTAEHDSARSGGFYVSLDGTPGEMALLANALLKARENRLPLLPSGEATIERGVTRSLSSEGKTVRATQYLISGIDYSPRPVWLDDSGELFASGSSWQITIRKGWESSIDELLTAQNSIENARLAKLAAGLRSKPSGAVLFRNARLFDSETGRMLDNMSVVVSGNRITTVGSSSAVVTPPNAQVIDVHGRTLMPGLWDMHVHIEDFEGMQHIASGVTSVRDMANDTDELMRRKARFDEGSLIGPRVTMAGIIEGVDPLAAPTSVRVDTEEKARAAVDNYAKLGYVQIKVYSSVKPELVPAIIDQAHKRGLRVSGHVPAFMTAEQVVKLGFDELQHANFLFLNFWADSVKDTRAMLRFTAVAERASTLDLSSQRVREFVKLLKDSGVVVDPTVNIFENFFVARAGQVAPGYVAVAERLPAAVRRGLLAGGLQVPEGKDSVYRAALPAVLRMIKLMYDAGVPIVAGTDGPAGIALHRELELYSMAGIPNAEVLRIATLGAARIMKMDDSVGVIAKGKLADLIIVDGDPLKNMSDIRRVSLTMKDGVIYDAAKVNAAMGVKPIR